MQHLLSSEKRTLDHWATVQLFFSLAQVRCFWRCFCFRSGLSPFSWRCLSVVTPASVHSLWSSPKCFNLLCLTVFSSLQSSMLLVHIFLPKFFLPVNFAFNMLWYSTHWTATPFINDPLWLTLHTYQRNNSTVPLLRYIHTIRIPEKQQHRTSVTLHTHHSHTRETTAPYLCYVTYTPFAYQRNNSTVPLLRYIHTIHIPEKQQHRTSVTLHTHHSHTRETTAPYLCYATDTPFAYQRNNSTVPLLRYRHTIHIPEKQQHRTSVTLHTHHSHTRETTAPYLCYATYTPFTYQRNNSTVPLLRYIHTIHIPEKQQHCTSVTLHTHHSHTRETTAPYLCYATDTPFTYQRNNSTVPLLRYIHTIHIPEKQQHCTSVTLHTHHSHTRETTAPYLCYATDTPFTYQRNNSTVPLLRYIHTIHIPEKQQHRTSVTLHTHHSHTRETTAPYLCYATYTPFTYQRNNSTVPLLRYIHSIHIPEKQQHRASVTLHTHHSHTRETTAPYLCYATYTPFTYQRNNSTVPLLRYIHTIHICWKKKPTLKEWRKNLACNMLKNRNWNTIQLPVIFSKHL